MQHVVEERTDATHATATWRLDLDHVGVVIAEQLATELALLVGKLQHAQARERPG